MCLFKWLKFNIKNKSISSLQLSEPDVSHNVFQHVPKLHKDPKKTRSMQQKAIYSQQSSDPDEDLNCSLKQNHKMATEK